ncbi:hypothetical protein PUN4_1070010 [Paraburkholderia unamae]|nr:hypothetical protein PUN4_1070010 [Paraburkholderia unamae]
MSSNIREWAMFTLAIGGNLRACELTRLLVQQETQRTVRSAPGGVNSGPEIEVRRLDPENGHENTRWAFSCYLSAIVWRVDTR